MTETRATKKQQVLFQYICDFIAENDYGPSYREVMSALGYKSVSTVAFHINELIARGYLEKKDKSARSLAVVGSSPVKSTAMPPHSSLDLVSELKKKMDDFQQRGDTQSAQVLASAIECLQTDNDKQ